ncbi:MAG: TorD/DmsD family molecular chaperone [Bradyrhizobium sp.]
MSDHGAGATIRTRDCTAKSARGNAALFVPISDTALGEGDHASSSPRAIRAARMLDDADAARAREYALLAALLWRAPDDALLRGLSGIRGDSTPLGIAHAALARAAEEANLTRLEREFFDLFIGVGRGELLPYSSYYLTGFLNERPLARLRDDLRKLGIVRAENQTEPEDHAAMLCEMMAGLVAGSLPAPADAPEKLFKKHLAPWIGRFFADLEQNANASFYRHVAKAGRLFIDIETEAFALPS